MGFHKGKPSWRITWLCLLTSPQKKGADWAIMCKVVLMLSSVLSIQWLQCWVWQYGDYEGKLHKHQCRWEEEIRQQSWTFLKSQQTFLNLRSIKQVVTTKADRVWKGISIMSYEVCMCLCMDFPWSWSCLCGAMVVQRLPLVLPLPLQVCGCAWAYSGLILAFAGMCLFIGFP